MNLLLLSDTHGKHKQLTNLPSADVVDCVIHAGDISTMGWLKEIRSFLEWYSSLPYKHKLFIAGNHDMSFEIAPYRSEVKAIVKEFPDIIYLEDESTVIEGISIHGSPWTPRFYHWAFNADRGEPISKKWKKIPHGTDILVVHGPPKGYGDKTVHEGSHVGCEDLLERVLEVKPKLVIFGHIHEGYGMYNITNDITGINCSVLDEEYCMVNDPVLINYYDFV